MKHLTRLLAALALLVGLTAIGSTAAIADTLPPEHPGGGSTDGGPGDCVPKDAYTETTGWVLASPGAGWRQVDKRTVTDKEAYDEDVFDHWQRYSHKGGWDSNTEPPPFPSDDWQANVQGDPHGVGHAGAYFRSNGNSGNGDWFYLEAVTTAVHHEAVTHDEYKFAFDHPAVTCEPTKVAIPRFKVVYGDCENPATLRVYPSEGMKTFVKIKNVQPSTEIHETVVIKGYAVVTVTVFAEPGYSLVGLREQIFEVKGPKFYGCKPVPTPVPVIDDPCGPDNAAYAAEQPKVVNMEWIHNADGSLTADLMVGEEFFENGQNTMTFPKPTDSNVACIVPEIPEVVVVTFPDEPKGGETSSAEAKAVKPSARLTTLPNTGRTPTGISWTVWAGLSAMLAGLVGLGATARRRSA